MNWFNKGKSDAASGKGQQDMRNAPAPTREQYVAGHNRQREDQAKKK